MTAPQPPAPILPGATLGVLGGGQLGRMFVHAAQALGYDTAVLDPAADSPAGRVSQHHVQAGYFSFRTGTGENQHAFSQARFTAKGVKWVASLWAGHLASHPAGVAA